MEGITTLASTAEILRGTDAEISESAVPATCVGSR